MRASGPLGPVRGPGLDRHTGKLILRRHGKLHHMGTGPDDAVANGNRGETYREMGR